MKKVIILMIAMMMLLCTAAAEGDYSVVTPNGAPALAVAALGERVQVLGDPSEIAGVFAKNEADFIIAPLNAGAMQYKKGNTNYRLAAVVTWGNLVFASQTPDFSLESINGKQITLFGENTINASVALYILREKGITPSETEYKAGAAETQAMLIKDPDVIVMTAEPAVTAAKLTLKKEDKSVVSISLYDLYMEITGEDGFAQAGLFVREETIRNAPELVKKGLEEIKASADKCADDIEGAAADAVSMSVIPNENVAKAAIPGCHIRYISAADARVRIERLVSIDPAQFGGETPADEFYYDGE